MSLRSRPLWFEGQLIRPQHLQQLVRWVESATEHRALAAAEDGWGVESFALDPTLLPLGKVGLERCRAILPDGTPVELPSREPAPPALAVHPDQAGRIVFLAVPARSGDATEANGETARFVRTKQVARDTTGQAQAAEVDVGLPNLRLVLEGDPSDDLICLPLARIKSVAASGALTMDEAFIPPSVHMGSHPRFAAFAREAAGMLKQRGDHLADQLDPSRAGNALGSMVDFALLQLINASEPVFLSLMQAPSAKPARLYWELLRLAGGLSTFSRTRRRPATLPNGGMRRPARCCPSSCRRSARRSARSRWKPPSPFRWRRMRRGSGFPPSPTGPC